ncbi:MAG: hypothetical protein ACUVX8_03970, partial [Candidatus Zipacnadales bacterium]
PPQLTGSGPSLPPLSIDHEAWQRLQHTVRGLEADRRFDQALSWAEAYDPEIGDWRWDYLVVKSQTLLMATDRLRNRLTEIAALVRAAPEEWRNPSLSNDPEITKQAQLWYDSAIRQASCATNDLEVVVRFMPTVLASLLLMGARDPFGRMSSTRFALLSADLEYVEHRLERAVGFCRTAARDVALAESERFISILDGLTSVSADPTRATYEGLAGTRFGLAPETIALRVQQIGGLGKACRACVFEQLGIPLEGGLTTLTYSQAEAMRIILRVLTCEAKAETIRPAETNLSGSLP